MYPPKTFLPFLDWLPTARTHWRADLIAGISVALVLIPQSMAYAQLAGLPAYYGLYAAFLPGIVAALWGSSAQLATGPVAVASLLTASALAPLAALGTEPFIALAIMLACMVGLIQLALGAFRLGVLVNFISHPVIVGFTSAAAIIIGLSQLNKLLGVSIGRSESFMQDIWGVLLQVGDTHVPTLLMGLGAFAIMWGLRRYAPRLPGVLIAVALATFVSWATGFERSNVATIGQINDIELRTLAHKVVDKDRIGAELARRITERRQELNQMTAAYGTLDRRVIALRYELELLQAERKEAEREQVRAQRALQQFAFHKVADGADTVLYLTDRVPTGQTHDGQRWRVRAVRGDEVHLSGGGAVVGDIPSGLPRLEMPSFSWDAMVALLSSAIVISLVGFMEAISIAKAMAVKTRARIDPNQELIGQGLANIVGSFSQSYPVSGSFSRSAVNLNAGAVTGMSSVFAGGVVLITLLFLTPLLHHLPQAVLAAVIMLAVIGLINFKAMLHAWQAHRHDGAAAVTTFAATLTFAPHLDLGILVGAGLAVILYLLRTMRPHMAILGRGTDGHLEERAGTTNKDEEIVIVRFDGALYFANVACFEDAILEAVANQPAARYLLVVGNGISQIDASGEDVLHHLVERLRLNDVDVLFSGLNPQVLEVMRRTGLERKLAGSIFPNELLALTAIADSRPMRDQPDAGAAP
ncbi:MAG: SulP family inorganic anion transporter [Chromatiales bacterium]|jgi:SulP family sulfate permease|nr:SulP family inorganic anion transporter [Chromatiales bacterium]MDX9765829.1 SulP family inorganic anion transporter [Ectothiorhodospiraceae bacterium]